MALPWPVLGPAGAGKRWQKHAAVTALWRRAMSAGCLGSGGEDHSSWLRLCVPGAKWWSSSRQQWQAGQLAEQ